VADAFLHGLRPAIYNRLSDRYDGVELDEVLMDDLIANASKEEVILNSGRAHGERVKKGNHPDHSPAPRVAAYHVVPNRPMRRSDENNNNPNYKQDFYCKNCGNRGHPFWECPNSAPRDRAPAPAARVNVQAAVAAPRQAPAPA